MSINNIKYQNTILYLAQKLGGAVQGKKKLAKLLYYVDFDRFEYKESMQSVTGDTYKAWKMGPVPQTYMDIIEDMTKAGSIVREKLEVGDGYNPTDTFISQIEPDLSLFDKDDIAILDHVVHKYGGLNGTQLQDLTHAEAPYVATEPDEQIDYELAFYRETDFADVVANA